MGSISTKVIEIERRERHWSGSPRASATTLDENNDCITVLLKCHLDIMEILSYLISIMMVICNRRDICAVESVEFLRE